MTCRDFIRTVPVLQHDKNKPEDIDTDGEDHVGDEARYACLSRPWAQSAPAREQQRKPGLVIGGRSNISMDDLWKTAPAAQRRV